MIFLHFFDMLVFFDNFFSLQFFPSHFIDTNILPWLLFLEVLQLCFFFHSDCFLLLKLQKYSGANDNPLLFTI